MKLRTVKFIKSDFETFDIQSEEFRIQFQDCWNCPFYRALTRRLKNKNIESIVPSGFYIKYKYYETSWTGIDVVMKIAKELLTKDSYTFSYEETITID